MGNRMIPFSREIYVTDRTSWKNRSRNTSGFSLKMKCVSRSVFHQV